MLLWILFDCSGVSRDEDEGKPRHTEGSIMAVIFSCCFCASDMTILQSMMVLTLLVSGIPPGFLRDRSAGKFSIHHIYTQK